MGALGSQANNDKRRKRLAAFSVPPHQLTRLHGPIGLPLGSKTPAEIALATLTGVTATRHDVRLETAAEAATGRSMDRGPRLDPIGETPATTLRARI